MRDIFQLTDEIETHSSLNAKRQLFATFDNQEKSAIVNELCAREHRRFCSPGTLARVKHETSVQFKGKCISVPQSTVCIVVASEPSLRWVLVHSPAGWVYGVIYFDGIEEI